MGTRGLIGFRYKGKDKLTYNHYDSYPSGVGKDILNEVRGKTKEELIRIFEGIILVSEGLTIGDDVIKRYKHFADTDVSSGNITEWYVLLRNTQGTLKYYFDNSLSHMIDGNDFIKDGLFCEWAYIVNIDTMKLEIWKGCQKKTQKNNRYGQEGTKSWNAREGNYYDNGYKPCKMIKAYSLNKLPTEKQFLTELKEDE